MAASTENAQTGLSLLDEPVIYRDLRAWLEQQEQNPRPLSPLQRRAIADLIKRAPETPDLGGRDWVTLLNLYAQAHRTGPPTFSDEVPAPARFISRVQFRPTGEAEYMVFPSAEGGGLLPDDTGTPVPPHFTRKKDAKQYAAKCCIEYLMGRGFMPTDGLNVEFPKPKPLPAPATAKAKKKNAAASNPNPNLPAKTSNGENQDETEPATTIRVETLCRLMGLAVPTYRITPSAEVSSTTGKNEYWDGYADFGPDAIKVPEGLGRVANVYGKKNARERIAEEVLEWLVREERTRREEADALMAQLGFSVKGRGEGGGELMEN